MTSPPQEERVGAHSSLSHANMKRNFSLHFSSAFLSLFHRASTELMVSRPAWRSFARPLRMGRSWWSCPRPPPTTSAMS